MDRQRLYLSALLGRARVYHFSGDSMRAMSDYRKLSARAPSAAEKMNALDGMSSLYGQLGDYTRELSCANDMICISRRMDRCSRGKALHRKACALRDQGDYMSSLRFLGSSIRLFQRARSARRSTSAERREILEHISQAYNSMGMVYDLQSRYAKALEFYKKNLDLSKKTNNLMTLTQATNNVGLIHWHADRYRKAMDFFNRSLANARKIGYRTAVTTILGNIGLVYKDLEQYKPALGCFKSAIAISREIGSQENTAIHLNNAALCYENMGDLNNTFQLYTQSLNVFRRIGNLFGTAMVLSNLGMNLCDQGDYEKALACEAEAERISKNADIRETLVRCYTVKGRILRIRKRYEDAIRMNAAAFRLAGKNRMGMLRTWAAKQMVLTAIQAKERKYLGSRSKYVIQLRDAYRGAESELIRCALRPALIAYERFQKNNDAASKMIDELARIAGKNRYRDSIIEALLARARLNRAAGREYMSLVEKGKRLARESGYMHLYNELIDAGR